MKTYTGINVQFPISQDILTGEKTIETRTYPIPEKYLGKEMVMIETPGKKGKFKSRVVALVKFTKCHAYKNKKEFYADVKKHLVDPNSDWAWRDKPKYGWTVEIIKVLRSPKEFTRTKGIIFTRDVPFP